MSHSQAAAAGAAHATRGRDCWGSEWGQAGLSEPAHQRPICQAFPRDSGEQTQGKGAKFGIAYSRDFLAFCRGFKEKWVSLLEGNVEMLETQYSLQRWGERLWALFFQKNRESPHGLGNVKWAGYTSSFLILPDRVEERLNLLCGCSTSVGHWDALKMSEVDCVVYCGQMHGKDYLEAA